MRPRRWLSGMGLVSILGVQAAEFQGEPMSLDFQDVELRSVLQVMAEHAGVNLLASDSVQGRITLRLEEVPWDQALDLVLRSKGLGKRQEGNVLLIAPLAELADQARRMAQDVSMEPLRRELIPVFHAKAGELVELLLASLADDGILAGRGSLGVDARTNTLVVTQPAGRLVELRRLVAELDVPVRQVMIEARIVEASVDYEKALGVRWGGPLYGAESRLGSDLFVDLGVERAGAGLGLGLLRSDILLDLELTAMEKAATARSSPSQKW